MHYHNSITQALLTAFTLVSALAMEVRGGVITGVTIHDVSSELPSFFRLAEYVVDGSGLSGGAHDIQPNFTSWLNSGGAVGAQITFDLGANYDLVSMRVWNYNEANELKFLDRGARDVAISYATSIGGGFVSVGNYIFEKATGVGDTGHEYSLDLNSARLVRFDISTSHQVLQTNDGGFVGLSEVQFSESTASVPEPSTLTALTIILSSFLYRAYRNRNPYRIRS